MCGLRVNTYLPIVGGTVATQHIYREVWPFGRVGPQNMIDRDFDQGSCSKGKVGRVHLDKGNN